MAHKNFEGVARQKKAHKLGAELDFASSEAYKLLRTNLSFSIPNKDKGRVIGLTSARPGDGKSYTAINLAYSLAEAGNRVLLIDADMRRSSIAMTLDKPLSPGLSNYLVGDAKDVIHKSVLHESLSLITAGDLPPNPAELIGSERMGMMLGALSQRYDYVILDLPPVSLVADPLVISKHLDGIVLVLRHSYSRCGEIKDAVRQLKFVNAHILGFVYNGYDKGRGYRRHGYAAMPANTYSKPQKSTATESDRDEA